jgi:hypothetical protein
MPPIKPSDVLVLSRLPGSGKTYYARWLERHGWHRIECGRLRIGPLDRAWADLITQDPITDATTRCFIDAAAAVPSARLVVEWGFPIQYLSRIRGLLGAGFDCWWFDGDQQASLRSWRRAWSKTRDDEWWA